MSNTLTTGYYYVHLFRCCTVVFAFVKSHGMLVAAFFTFAPAGVLHTPVLLTALLKHPSLLHYYSPPYNHQSDQDAASS
jgi:hypothetical protein